MCLPAKAGIQPWNTTKRGHEPESRRKRPKASLVAANFSMLAFASMAPARKAKPRVDLMLFGVA
jgi:hypothetical protein